MEVDERKEVSRTWIVKNFNKRTYGCKMLAMSIYPFPCKATTWNLHSYFSMAGIINEFVQVCP